MAKRPDFDSHAFDFYQLLGIDPTANEKQIKSAYHRAIRKYHPDFHPDDLAAEEMTKRINEAYSTLSDARKRAAYDASRHEADQPPPQVEHYVDLTITLKQAYYGLEKLLNVAGIQVKTSIPPGVSDGDELTVRVNNIIIYLKMTVTADKHLRRDGLDLHLDHPVDVFTAMLGGEIIVKVFDDEIVVKIPPSTSSDQVLRLRNKGMASLEDRAKRGSLYLRLMIRVPRKLSYAQREKVEQLAAQFKQSDW